jgi:hypothetical protein
MRNPAPPVLLAALLVLAGCAAPAMENTPAPAGEAAETATDAGGETQSTPTAAAGATPTPATTSAPAPAPSATATAAPAERNPWGSDPIVVGIENRDAEARNYVPVVHRATAYWEEHAERYAGFEVDYTVDPTAESPDVIVTFVDDVPRCGVTEDAAGCAPYIRRADQISRPERVFVRTGLADESTALVLEHELGHTLGLGHDDAPQGVMRAKSVLRTTPRPNATDRAFPWTDSTFEVYVDDGGVESPERVREQVRHATAYYERGADGTVPTNLSFAVVDDPDEADVVVEFAEESPCGKGSGSCFTTVGPDPDGDDAIETYSKLRVVVVDLEPDAVGWHVGNWLAYGLGMEAAGERPAPFREAGYRERRGEWWTDDE